MSTIEETKVIQSINRLEDARRLLNEVNRKDNRFAEKFSAITSQLEKYEEYLREIQSKLNIENLGHKEMPLREL